MCKLCEAGFLQAHGGSRRKFLRATTAAGIAASGLGLFAVSYTHLTLPTILRV